MEKIFITTMKKKISISKLFIEPWCFYRKSVLSIYGSMVRYFFVNFVIVFIGFTLENHWIERMSFFNCFGKRVCIIFTYCDDCFLVLFDSIFFLIINKNFNMLLFLNEKYYQFSPWYKRKISTCIIVLLKYVFLVHVFSIFKKYL